MLLYVLYEPGKPYELIKVEIYGFSVLTCADFECRPVYDGFYGKSAPVGKAKARVTLYKEVAGHLLHQGVMVVFSIYNAGPECVCLGEYQVLLIGAFVCRPVVVRVLAQLDVSFPGGSVQDFFQVAHPEEAGIICQWLAFLSLGTAIGHGDAVTIKEGAIDAGEGHGVASEPDEGVE